MDNNVIAVLAAALIDLQNIVAAPRERRITLLLTFSERAEEDVWEFI